MTTRQHPRVGITHEGVTRSGYKIACSTPDCGAVDAINCPKPSGLPHETVTHKFSQKGWTVARNADHDLCPACTRAKMMRNKVVPIQSQAVTPVTPETPVTHAEAPREMEREDRRIIFLKLNEIYLDETKGYSAGWTDKRVATELGTPVAWVRQVREENFGPEGLSEADRAKIEAAKEYQLALDDLEKRHDDLRQGWELLAREIAALKRQFSPVARDVQDVRKAVVGA